MSDRLTPPRAHAAVRKLADIGALDAPAKKLASTVRKVIRPGKLKDALSGTWLGHPVHPPLTDVPIGTYTSALLLDWLGGRRSQPAADRLIALGLLSTLPVVASGYSDWTDSEMGNDAMQLPQGGKTGRPRTSPPLRCSPRRTSRAGAATAVAAACWRSPAAPRSGPAAPAAAPRRSPDSR